MIVRLLTEHHLEFLSFKGGCRGSSESTLVKMPHCWKSHVTAQLDDKSLCVQQSKVVVWFIDSRTVWPRSFCLRSDILSYFGKLPFTQSSKNRRLFDYGTGNYTRLIAVSKFDIENCV